MTVQNDSDKLCTDVQFSKSHHKKVIKDNDNGNNRKIENALVNFFLTGIPGIQEHSAPSATDGSKLN